MLFKKKVGTFKTIDKMFFKAGASAYVMADMGGADRDYTIPKGATGSIYMNKMNGVIFLEFKDHPRNLSKLPISDPEVRSRVTAKFK